MTNNEKPFEHICHNGSQFVAERSDFVGGVSVLVSKNITEEQLMADCGEFCGWHAANIWPTLNGFSGYASIQYTVIRK